MICPYNGNEVKNPELIAKTACSLQKALIRPKVVIRCIAYNQEPYIVQTLEGFISQKTDFPFIALVHDDSSNDKTAEIIREYAKKYPEIIVPVCDTVNRHTERTLLFIMDTFLAAANPKYVAICEGDDYWTDPMKLQKQVDYMDGHPECVLCHGDHKVSTGEKRKAAPHYDDEPYFGEGHRHTYTIAALTVLYRYDTYNKIHDYRKNHTWRMGDYPLWIELSKEGKFHYFNDVFGVYRIVTESASHSSDGEKVKKFWQSWNDITKFYSELYDCTYTERTQKAIYLDIQKQCYLNRDKAGARKYWEEAKQNKATCAKSFLYYVSTVCNTSWILKLVYKFT